MLVGAVAIERDEKEISAQDEMKNSDCREESKTFPNLLWRHEQNVADEHLFDLFVSFRGAAEEQDGRGRGDHIRNSNHRFLWNLTGAFSGDRKNCCAYEGEPKRNREGRPTLQIEMK